MGKPKIKSLKINSKSDKNPPHGKNPSNKGINLKLSEDLIAKSYNQHNICILKPIIDKLVLRYDLPAVWDQKHKDQFKTFVYSYLNDHGKAGDWDYEYVPSSELQKNNGRYAAYKRNLWLKHSPSGENILVQTDPKKAGTPFFRFDFNPSRLGAKGVIFFKKELDFLFCKQEFGISYSDILSSPKAVYRLDIAVDILGVDISDLEIEYSPHGNQIQSVKPMQYLSETGRTQTTYPNALLNGDNKTYLYNKKHEQADKGEPPLYEDALHTRFEHRYKEWNRPISHLSKIGLGTTPLKKVNIRWIDYKAIQNEPYDHVLFLQYARQRGLKKALEVIPEHNQMAYISSHKKAMTPIWYPEEIWAYWPSCVETYGLLEA